MIYLFNAMALMISLACNAILILFLARLAAEAARADFHNPLSQAIYRTTNPILAPIRRLLPNWRNINLAAIVTIYLLLLLKYLVLGVLAGKVPNLSGSMVLALGHLLDSSMLFYLILIFVWSLLSLLSGATYHPLQHLLDAITKPLLYPLRGKLTFGMLDFSPFAVMVILSLGRILVAAPLIDFGTQLTAIH